MSTRTGGAIDDLDGAGADDLRLLAAEALGGDAGRGNLLGIQPWMEPRHYATAERFAARMDAYLAAAGARGWLGPRTVAVLPEYLGTWLVLAGAGPAVLAAATLRQAMVRLLLERPLSVAAALPGAGWRVVPALFRARAARMAAIYERTCSALARRYGITLVAGSILLPAPGVRNGRMVIGRGPLYNAAVVFGPDGAALAPPARKRFLTEAEQPFTAPAPQAEPPVYTTPAGRLGVLVCADAFFPESYAPLAASRAGLLAVPSYLEHAGCWEQPWPGYNGAPPPADVSPTDPGRIREGDAWLRYGMAGRMARAGIPHGVNVFLRGRMWDLGSDGPIIAVRGCERSVAPRVDGASLLCVWL
jgi:predicted amidohydrolase